jgi:hypothetical protein
VSSLFHAKTLLFPIDKSYPRSIIIAGHAGKMILSPMIILGST